MELVPLACEDAFGLLDINSVTHNIITILFSLIGRSCVTDVCECPDGKRCECESFRAYARTCAQENINISWEDKAPCSGE